MAEITTTAPWDDGFTAGYNSALQFAIAVCNERAAKHAARKTRLAVDYQSEANACAFAIQRKSDQKSDARRVKADSHG